MNWNWKKYLELGAVATVVLLIIKYSQSFLDFFGLLFGILLPIIAGCVIAYVINIIMSFYERHYFRKSKSKFGEKSRRPVCMIGAVLTVLVVLVILAALVTPEIANSVNLILTQLPSTISELLKNETIASVLPEDIVESLRDINWNELFNMIVDMLSSGAAGNIANSVIGAVSSVFGTVSTVFIGVVFALYILGEKEKLGAQFKDIIIHYLPEKFTKNFLYFCNTANRCFHSFIVGQCTDAIILGCLCAVGMFILQMPYVLMVSAMVSFTALIPFAGAYIGSIAGMLIILTISPVKAIIFIIFITILNNLEGNLIYPRVVGNSIGLPAIWVIAAVTVGGGLGGIPGMIFGVPLTATFYSLISDNLNKKREKKGAAQ